MDVTCDRCGTEYEFDETLVSARGTTVKCTHCGHVFKVFPSSAAAVQSWTVQTRRGTTYTLESLRELQHLIADGSLAEDDQIARGNEAFKRMGDIAELKTFFDAALAEVNTAAPNPVRGLERPRRGTTPGLSAPRFGSTPPVPRGRNPVATMVGVGGRPAHEPGGAPAVPALGSEVERVPETRPDTSPSRDLVGADTDPDLPPEPTPGRPPRTTPAMAVPNLDLNAAGWQPAAAGGSVEGATVGGTAVDGTVVDGADERRGVEETVLDAATTQPDAPPMPDDTPALRVRTEPSTRKKEPVAVRQRVALGDEEPVTLPRGRSRSGLWVGLVLLLAIGAGVGLYWPTLAPMLGLVESEDRLAPLLAEGHAALAEDHPAAYRMARERFGAALALDRRDPRALTGQSQAEALLAQGRRFEADDAEARGEDAAAIRAEAAEHAERALAAAEEAVRHNGDGSAEVALADALRLTGDLDRARSRLVRARTLQAEQPAETRRVEALLRAAEGEDLARAREGAQAAVDHAPSSHRSRLLLARILLASGEVGLARQQVDAVLAMAPEHPTAVALRDAIEEGRPPAPQTIEMAPDAGEDTSPETPPVASAEEEVDTPPTEATPVQPVEAVVPRGITEPVPAGRDYGWYVRRGDESLERGDAARARDYYEAARQVRPTGSEALNGLGYVALEAQNVEGAISAFRQAARQGFADAYIGLGSAYRRVGQLDAAVRAYESYLERLPNGPRARIARRQVEELRRQLPSAEPAPDPSEEPGDGPSEGAPPPEAQVPPSDEPDWVEPDEEPPPQAAPEPPAVEEPPPAEPAPPAPEADAPEPAPDG